MIQGLLHDRLFGASGAPKRALQCQVGTQARVDLDDAVRSSQYRDKTIIQFVGGRLLNGFLRNPHHLTNRGEQTELLDLNTNGGQTRTGRAVLTDYGRLVHDGSPVVGWRTYR